MLMIVKMAPAMATSKLSMLATEPASISTLKTSIKRGATKQAMSAFMKSFQWPTQQARLHFRHCWLEARRCPEILTQLGEADHSYTNRSSVGARYVPLSDAV